MSDRSERKVEFHLRVLGKTLHHLGVQLYKRRDMAIAELVSNSWDAGANIVEIELKNSFMDDPNDPSKRILNVEKSEIIIKDDGCGMNEGAVQDQYLVVGRNRRAEGQDSGNPERPVIGRKGLGKLGGFGIADAMAIKTWKNGKVIEFDWDKSKLYGGEGEEDVTQVPIGGIEKDAEGLGSNGTIVTLKSLKHKTPLDEETLSVALARMFGRRVRGQMKIYVNGNEVKEPELSFLEEVPSEENEVTEKVEVTDGREFLYLSHELPSGEKILYRYGCADSPLKNKEYRGFIIYANGKMVQSPDFFFEVEATASGQFGTRYLSGEIHADFVDSDDTDDGDLISTDRQSLKWEEDRLDDFKVWGQRTSRAAIRWCADLVGRDTEYYLLNDEDFISRMNRMDSTSHKQVESFLKILSKSDRKKEKTRDLADSLIRAFEFRQFHDLIDDINEVASEDEPEKLAEFLEKLGSWQVLESRAILEIVQGRLNIIEKFDDMLVNDAPETPSSLTDDNLHDLLAWYPWLLNPEWQVLSEEKSLTKQLKEWNAEDVSDPNEKLRYDFLALEGDGKYVVIEIKRSGHIAELDELHRLEKYKSRLKKSRRGDFHMVFICGQEPALEVEDLQTWKERKDLDILLWKDVFERVRNHYEHYRDVLIGNVDGNWFHRKITEVAQTRRMLDLGTAHRGKEPRKMGVGPTDVEFKELDPEEN